jgi:hypothetical protein
VVDCKVKTWWETSQRLYTCNTLEENTYIQGTTEKRDFMMTSNKIIYSKYCFDVKKLYFLSVVKIICVKLFYKKKYKNLKCQLTKIYSHSQTISACINMFSSDTVESLFIRYPFYVNFPAYSIHKLKITITNKSGYITKVRTTEPIHLHQT